MVFSIRRREGRRWREGRTWGKENKGRAGKGQGATPPYIHRPLTRIRTPRLWAGGQPHALTTDSAIVLLARELQLGRTMAGACPSIALAVGAADGLVLGSQTTLH